MDLSVLLGANAGAGPKPAGDSSSDAAAARWRYELERAQWAQRTGDAADSSGRPAREGGQRGAPDLSSPHVASAAEATRGGQAGRARPEDEAPDRASGPARAFLPGDPPRAQVREGIPAPEAAIETRSSAETSDPDAHDRRQRLEGREWERTHLHATNVKDGARLWVRDASIADGSLEGLAADLRLRLRAAGLRLAGLVVNGKTVVEAPPSFEEGARDGNAD